MHNTGQMMSTELIRNGEVVRTTATDFFNFNFQGLVPEARRLRHHFWTIARAFSLAPFRSRLFQRHDTPHAPCDMLYYFVSMRIGC